MEGGGLEGDGLDGGGNATVDIENIFIKCELGRVITNKRGYDSVTPYQCRGGTWRLKVWWFSRASGDAPT